MAPPRTMVPQRSILNLMYPHGEFRGQVLLAMTREGWFIRLRWIIVIALLVLVGVERLFTHPIGRPAAIPTILAMLGLLNFIWSAAGKELLRQSENLDLSQVLWRLVALTNAQMVFDLAALTALLRYTGSIANPMAIFYLFHVLIAALLLRPFNALLQALWGLVLFTVVVVGEHLHWIYPHYALLSSAVSADRSTEWSLVVLTIFILAAGIFGSLFFTLQISSRLDAQEQRLLEINQALKASEAAIKLLQDKRSRFMQTAAHQLKAPVAAIETLANLIRDDVVPVTDVKPVIARIRARCHAAIEQVSELITLERIEQSGPERHRRARTNFAHVAHAVGLRFAVQARAVRIAFHEDIAQAVGARVAVEERDLDDCLANLIDNALKYTPEGGEVWIQAAVEGRKIRVAVRDTGMGIAADHLEHLFDPFRRGNEALAAGISGTGLGLTIVHEVLEQADGAIEVHSETGKGSTFTVWLPLADEQPKQTEQPTMDSIPGVNNHVGSGYFTPGSAGEYR